MQPYLQLVRLPNVFTAMADILLGFLFTHERLEPWPQFALLLAASSLLYLAGMVLNDFFDHRAGRPRAALSADPLGPSLADRSGAAGLWHVGAGDVLGWVASALCRRRAARRRGDAVGRQRARLRRACSRRTPAGPLVMGACRMLNVLLGMSLA